MSKVWISTNHLSRQPGQLSEGLGRHNIIRGFTQAIFPLPLPLLPILTNSEDVVLEGALGWLCCVCLFPLKAQAPHYCNPKPLGAVGKRANRFSRAVLGKLRDLPRSQRKREEGRTAQNGTAGLSPPIC